MLWTHSYDWRIESYGNGGSPSIIRRGYLSNLPAGFKQRGVRVRDEASPIQPGEFKDVDAPGGSLRDAFFPLPYKEPSQTLLNLLGIVVMQDKDLQQLLICKWEMVINKLQLEPQSHS